MKNNVVVVNEKDEVIGTVSREEAHRSGIPHRIAVVYVENNIGEILIQVRMNGRIDHSCAGHVDPNEEYIDTGKRELKEELGINNVELVYIGRGVSEEITPDKKEHRIHIMQIFSCIEEPKELQKDEVLNVYWANPKEILNEMKEKPNDTKFVNSFRISLPIYMATKV